MANFDTAREAFLDSLVARGRSRATVATRQSALRLFGAYLLRKRIDQVQDVTTPMIEEYCRKLFDRGLSPTTVGQYLRSIQIFLASLEKRGVIFEDPARGIACPRAPQPLPRVPSLRQMRRLLAQPEPKTALGLRDRALLEVLYGTGMRVGEAVRLTVNSADTGAGLVRVQGKGKVERIVPLGRNACAWLGRYLLSGRQRLAGGGHPVSALWIGSSGRALGRQAVARITQRHSIKAGIEPVICPHAVRRAAVTHMLQNGANPLALQAMLGHASLRHLNRYLALDLKDVQAMHRQSRLGD